MIAAAASSASDADPMLVVRDLKVSRGGRPILTHINLTLSTGSLVYVNGANGSGKTTFITTLAGLVEPDAGQVTWCGEATRRSVRYRSQMAYLAHHNGLHGDLTVAENLQYSAQLDGRPSIGGIDKALNEVLQSVGLESAGGRFLRHLSQGQQRRIALARLLLKKAKLWLLDEPFNSLDTNSVERFRDLLKAHLEQGGMVVASTHLPVSIDSAKVGVLQL